MRLLRLALRDFRNIVEVELTTGAPFVVFHGSNAQGKTNLIEAIFMLASLRSFRTHRSAELIRWGAERAELSAVVSEGEARRSFRLTLGRSQRRISVDGKVPRRLSDYFLGIRAVLFVPEDIGIVRGAPELRRRFLDRAVFTLDPAYLDIARSFRKVLSQKAVLLRGGAPELRSLRALDEQLAEWGSRVVQRRVAMARRLQGPFSELYGAMAGSERVSIRYRSCLDGEAPDEIESSYRDLLERSAPAERARRINLVGPQRDELEIALDGRSARACASQGQARTIVLALRLAELVVSREAGARPLFLLDDLSSELDRARTGRLVQLLSELDLQCVMTTTDTSRLGSLGEDRCLFWRVDGGRVERSRAPHASLLPAG